MLKKTLSVYTVYFLSQTEGSYLLDIIHSAIKGLTLAFHRYGAKKGFCTQMRLFKVRIFIVVLRKRTTLNIKPEIKMAHSLLINSDFTHQRIQNEQNEVCFNRYHFVPDANLFFVTCTNR